MAAATLRLMLFSHSGRGGGKGGKGDARGKGGGKGGKGISKGKGGGKGGKGKHFGGQ